MTLIEYVCDEYGYSEFVANGIIMAGDVLVNDEVCSWIKYKLKKNDHVRIRNKKNKFVTRSGYKLEEALQKFQIDVSEKVIVDIGASEGGFTDCLIEYGAAKVYSVDVAYGILNYKLRANPKVVPIERMNARNLSKNEITEPVDFITADVSFISLDKIIPSSLQFLNSKGKVILLFKPQFELKPECLGKNGIPINNEDVVEKIDFFVKEMEVEGLHFYGIIKSPIKGNSGNTEYLLIGTCQEENRISLESIRNCVMCN